MRHGIRVTVEFDPDAECPADWDEQWKLVSFKRNHIHFEPFDQYFHWFSLSGDVPMLNPVNVGLRRKLMVGTAFVLDYYQHTGSCWNLSGEGPQCNWDTRRAAGILLWEHPVKALGSKTYGARQEDARSFLEIYNAWANGFCYAYTVEHLDDEDFHDSCAGFYDADYMLKDCIVPNLQEYVDRHGLTRVERLDDLEELDTEDVEPEPGVLYLELAGDAVGVFDLGDFKKYLFPSVPEIAT